MENLVPLTLILIIPLPKDSLLFTTVSLKITPPLKTNSKPKAILFKSSTDTEVLIQLIEYIQVINRIDLLTAVQLALQEVIGAYAIAVLDRENPDEIIAARKSSPLVVGIGQDEFFLASDATPIVEYTDKVVYLEDEEIAVIRCGEKLKVVNLKNVECPHEVKTVALNLGQLEKGGYPHFMLKEILSNPIVFTTVCADALIWRVLTWCFPPL